MVIKTYGNRALIFTECEPPLAYPKPNHNRFNSTSLDDPCRVKFRSEENAARPYFPPLPIINRLSGARAMLD